MVIEGFGLAQNYAHKIVTLACVNALVENEPQMTVAEAEQLITLWTTDREEQLIEFATAIEQTGAVLLYDKFSQNFDIYDS